MMIMIAPLHLEVLNGERLEVDVHPAASATRQQRLGGTALSALQQGRLTAAARPPGHHVSNTRVWQHPPPRGTSWGETGPADTTQTHHTPTRNPTSFSPGNKLRNSISAPLSICPTSISYIILCCKSFWMYRIATSLSVVVDMNPSSSPTLAPESVGFRKRSDTLRPAIPRYTLPPDGVGVMRLTLISALVMAWTVDTYGKSPSFLRASRSASCLIFFSLSTRSSGS
eukprot:3936987-Rhodomonas_salina.1